MSKAKQYEKNMADQRLVVGDLVVLGNMKGANLKSIERRVDLIQKQTQTIGKMATYWKNLADDGVITPSEKSQLLKEWKGIAESYSAIRTQAEQQGWQYNSIFVDYTTAYNALHDYLYGTLKLFDDMDSDTAISDKDAFDQYFADYYYAEKFTLLSFTTGIIENFQFIVLSSLTDEGHDGDYGLYRGVIYMYANGAWHKAGNGSYLGKYVSGIPYLSIGDFFLAAANFNANVYLATEDAEIIKANNKPLAVSIAFEKGFIYEGTVKGWKKVNNRNDWKYIIAVDDLISINAEIPEHLKSFVNITAKEAVPQYLGLLTVAPVLATNMYTPAGGNGQQEYHTGDWFTWGGATTANWGNLTLTNGRVYKYYGDEWVQLDEQDTKNTQFFMTALTDILSTLESGAGYFSYIFANMLLSNEAFLNKLFANEAFIDRLGAKIIALQENGIIKSENYLQGVQGFCLKANGSFECNDGIFRGSIESGPLSITSNPRNYIKSYTAGTGISAIVRNLDNILLKDFIYKVSGTFGTAELSTFTVYPPHYVGVISSYTYRYNDGTSFHPNYKEGTVWEEATDFSIAINGVVYESRVIRHQRTGSNRYDYETEDYNITENLNMTIPAGSLLLKLIPTEIPLVNTKEDLDDIPLGAMYRDRLGILRIKLGGTNDYILSLDKQGSTEFYSVLYEPNQED